jgi:hypothetical protein
MRPPFVSHVAKMPVLVEKLFSMPCIEEHLTESITFFGTGFADVHRWLDEFAGKPPYGMRHRKLRHHQAGIEQVRHKWGDLAAEAARQHIISDLKTDGWKQGDPFPRDEADYVRIGLF